MGKEPADPSAFPDFLLNLVALADAHAPAQSGSEQV
jgi:hypothetical protein